MGDEIMLSIVDIKRELGENIYIYPVHSSSIKANSIDLRVSKFAWSLKTKDMIFDGVDHIIIPPHDTALIYSEESIYVSNKIGGSYHSKVTLVSLGLGHIGTTLDAQYLGNSLVAIHNHSDSSVSLQVGHEFVTLHFSYLNSPDYADTQSHDNEPGHPRMLNGFNDVDQYIEWRDANPWNTKRIELYHKMVESDEYKACKENFKKELEVFNRERIKHKAKKYGVLFVVILCICVIASIPSYAIDLGTVSSICASISEKVIFPICAAVVGAIITVDVVKDKKK